MRKLVGPMVVAALVGALSAVVPATTATASVEPVEVVQVATGFDSSCALLVDGRVKCWGANTFGQLGLGHTVPRGTSPGQMGDALPAVPLGAGRTAVQVVAGYDHTCALLDDGHVKCWGHNQHGQLGLGDSSDRGGRPGEMGDALPAVVLGSGRTAVQIAAGGDHSCALLDDGTVKCWGDGEFGALGLGDASDRGDGPGEMGDALPAVAVGAGRTVVELSTGDQHSCARLDDGSVKCWGHNQSGRLGLGDTADRGDGPGEMGDALPAVALGSGRTATQVSVGAYHSCARLDDDRLKCWGGNGLGQLGLGDAANRGDGPGEMGDALPAVVLGSGRTATQVSAGSEFTCARLDDGHVKCWGFNSSGQLGLGDTAIHGDGPGEMGDALPPVALGGGRTVAQVATGGRHTCARLDDGTTKCWGLGLNGELGLGDQDSRGTGPGQMGDALPVVELSDVRDPSVTISTPVEGAVADLEQVLVADFACADTGGSGLATCVGTVPDGTPVDTSTLGDRTFSVTATDHAGNVTTVDHIYTVVDDTTAPTVDLRTPPDGAVYAHGAVVPADFSCSDGVGGTGVASCEGSVVDGAPLDTSAIGDHDVSVTATDQAGNTDTVTHTYTVADARPDGWVRLGAATYKGDDRYNTTAVGQTVRGSAAPGRTVTYYVAAQNDAAFVDVLRLRGPGSNGRFRVTYTASGVDVTGPVTEGTYATAPLGPGSVQAIKVTVKVRSAAPAGSSFAGTVTMRSTADASVRDRVGYTTRRG